MAAKNTWVQYELESMTEESTIVIGQVGHQFVKLFKGRNGKDVPFAGEVDHIIRTGVRTRSFLGEKNKADEC